MSEWTDTCGFSSVGSDHLALKPVRIQVRIKKTQGYKTISTGDLQVDLCHALPRFHQLVCT